MIIPEDWSLDPENKESKRLNEIISSHARKLNQALKESEKKEDRYRAIFAFYRKYYTLTLCKSCLAAGVNKSPARDIILDFPWKELKQDRILCLQIWETINH